MTTQCRPHWDDDLLEAVSCLVSVDIGDDCLPAVDVCEVIAAVEDWVLSAPIFDLYLSRKHAPDKAAIQRVRELLKTGTFEAIIGAQRKSVVGEYDLRRALDGGAE